MRLRAVVSGSVVATALLLPAAMPSVEERLERQRNLGKAFFENPTTQNEAVAEFQNALALAPGSVRERLNYALALLHAGKAERAAVLLRQVQKLDPKLPHTWFNLGIHYRKNGNSELATQQFLGMLRLTPEERSLIISLALCIGRRAKLLRLPLRLSARRRSILCWPGRGFSFITSIARQAALPMPLPSCRHFRN